MSKKFFILSLALAWVIFPAMADDADSKAPPASAAPAETAEPSNEVTAPEAESSTPAPREAAFDPFASEPFQELRPAAGETCGGAICGKFEYCCNPSCALCVPFGMSCTQESCN